MSDNYLNTKNQFTVDCRSLMPGCATHINGYPGGRPSHFPMVNDSIMTESHPEMLQAGQKIRPQPPFRPGNQDIILHLMP